MTIEKTPQGAWHIYTLLTSAGGRAVCGGLFVSRRYFYHTKQQAIRLFKAEVRRILHEPR